MSKYALDFDALFETSAAVTAGNTEDASPALGEPDVDVEAASTSGTQSSGSESVGTGLGSGGGEPVCVGLGSSPTGAATAPVPVGAAQEQEERIEEETVEGGEVDLSSFDAAYLSADDLASIDPPAADLDDASQGVLQQPGPDSPTGRDLLAEEPLGPAVATADRSETDSPPVPEVLGITWIGLAEFDHHASAGVSDSGVAPAIAVEPVLEDGGLAPDPSSSSDPRDEPTAADRLLHALAQLVEVLDEMDPEAMGPYLFPAELVLLHQRADRIAEFVGRVGLARTQLAGNP